MQSPKSKVQNCEETGDWRRETRPSCSSQIFRLKPLSSRRASRLLTLVSPQPLAPAGFTLLEIMVALAILSLGIVTVLELFSGSLHIGVKASRHTQAAIYAQNIMDRVFAQTTIEDGEERGEFPDGYTWIARVQEIRPDDDGSRLQPDQPNQLDFFHLKEIEVRIIWDENGGAKTFVVRSLRTQAEQPNAQNITN
ncbi:MAG: prepilin-type N-terminal cleavage/methylation domain-containing protein [Candidatus Binatia bacterium]